MLELKSNMNCNKVSPTERTVQFKKLENYTILKRARMVITWAKQVTKESQQCVSRWPCTTYDIR